MTEPIKPIYPSHTDYSRPRKRQLEEKDEKDQKETGNNQKRESSSLNPEELQKMLTVKAGLPEIVEKFQKMKRAEEKAHQTVTKELEEMERLIKKIHELK